MLNDTGCGVGTGLLAALTVVWGVAVMIFWMVCAWRAMRAHEKLAESADRLSRKP